MALTKPSGKMITPIVMGTMQASTSGTSIDFTSIPAGVKRITVSFVGVSGSGTSNILVQIGDAGGVEVTGYSSGGWQGGSGDALATATSGFLATANKAGVSVLNGTVVLSLHDAATFTWAENGHLVRDDGAGQATGGSKSLSAELDRVRVTHVNGTDTFDAGSINIAYE